MGYTYLYLHYASRIPEEGVGVKVSRWIKPEVELLLSIALSLYINIRMYNIRLPTQVPKELEVYLIPWRSLWTQLKQYQNNNFSSKHTQQISI